MYKHDVHYQGRLSPWAKEDIYRSYLKGVSVKDLSLRYGIFAMRVKAVVYQKHLYWEEVYPRLGETHLRLAIDREMTYASETPFIDYGIDLKDMADFEKGILMYRCNTKENDLMPVAKRKPFEHETMKAFRKRRQDRVPIKFVGKGKGGFYIHDWIVHRGKGAARVSQQFN